jgi:hypothetical protein
MPHDATAQTIPAKFGNFAGTQSYIAGMRFAKENIHEVNL